MDLQQRNRVSRLTKSMFGFIGGVIVAALGTALFIFIGLFIYNIHDVSDLWIIVAVNLIVGILGCLLLYFGVMIMRDAIRSMLDRSLNGIDLKKQPWMAKAEWRNRRIEHRVGLVPVVGFLRIIAWGVLLAIVTCVVWTMPAAIAAIAALISGMITMAFGYLYRHLKKKKVAITMYEIPYILLLPVFIILPGAYNMFSPAINRLCEATGVLLMVFLVATILFNLHLKARKFGISICHLKTLPAFVGGTLEAEIEIEFPKVRTGVPELPEGPVEVVLQNYTQPGKHKFVQWSTTSSVPAQSLIRPGDGTLRIPVEIEIPNEASEKIGKPTEWWAKSGWTLGIRAPFSEVDYDASFLVPVYLPDSGL